MKENYENKHHILYLILDGIGDLPHPSIENKTPLEAAKTPNLDLLAKNGCMGQVITVGKGIAPQSDIAVFNMLGYNFKNIPYVGRGVVESIGCNIDFKEGDLALRGNFATVDTDMNIVDRRAGRIITKEEAKSICNTFNEKIVLQDPDAEVTVVPTIAHRVTIRFRHKKQKLSENITNTDPAYDKVNGIGIAKTDIKQMKVLECKPQDNQNSAQITANIINDFTKQVVLLSKNHSVNQSRVERNLNPMNCILVRDAGTKFPNYEPINKKYGLNTACMVDMPVEIGISKILGMDTIEAGGINDYEKKALVAAEKLHDYNLIYVHIKGPDEFGHDGDAVGKMHNIQDIDSRFIKNFISNVSIDNYVVVISGDHSTPCVKKSHSDDPVPLLVSGNLVLKDESLRFTETCAKKGIIGTIMGSDVINKSLKLISNNKSN
ncbi:MAG: alkaline phosphatase family protein [Nitrososphaeraceae archaeon]